MKNRHLDVEIPTQLQFSGMFRELRELVTQLEQGAEVEFEEDGQTVKGVTPGIGSFLHLAAAAYRDGYPTASMQPSGRSSILDEDGHAIPPLSDPVGELASAEHRIVDPIRAHAQSVLRGLTGALGDLRMAKGALVRGSQYAQISPGEPGCRSHAIAGIWAPATRPESLPERCRWCYDFERMHHQDPPVELIKLHDDGRLVTVAMVKKALSVPRTRRRNP